ncbi:MAG: DNA-directed RNA polymerase subunit beta' [Mollicutes bacterium]|nr:DNA-directed RNA polymerase subunit beta' [Mollicutes bacterium]MDY6069974.1 DNA-directed RNA polymerase subunit beta' [Bacilli bacterium]
MFDINNLAAMQVGLASPETIRNWSHGEVINSETINYRSHKPEFGGLFCEQIFGPVKDYECSCGKYKKMRFQGTTCEKCHVEVISKEWRRERFGHIELVSPCTHIWYLKGIPSRIGLVLDMSPKELEEIVYFAGHICLNPGTSTVLKKKEFFNDSEDSRNTFVNAILAFKDQIPEGSADSLKAEEIIARLQNRNETFDFLSTTAFVAKYTGAEFGEGAASIKRLLQEVDLEEEYKTLTAKIHDATGQARLKLAKRLEVIEAFRNSNQKPEWMVLDVIPVIPPELRPMLQLDGGRFTDSDINDLYRRVIIRNNRLKKLIENNSPSVILMNEKRMLQEAVDALIDNGRRGKPTPGKNGRPLKSLSSGLKGKQGRFRQNLLGKRVDYSGRSVIAVGPSLKMYQCGLPREMAVQLLRPFIAAILLKRGVVTAHRQADKLIDAYDPKVYDIVEEIIGQHPVLLNRAPTLHRLSIQAFQPVLVDGHAIRLHPLVCPGFNADFDGDQMAVHVPLGKAAQEEALDLMLASNNILGPKDGKAIVIPSQDMVLGNYYLTEEESRVDMLNRARDIRKVTVYDEAEKTANEKAALQQEEYSKQEGRIFGSVQAVMEAYETGSIQIHTRIVVPAKALHKTFGDDLSVYALPSDVENKYLITTVGKIIFNELFPDDFVFINSNKPASINRDAIESWFVSPKELQEKHDALEEKIAKLSDEDAVKYLVNTYFKKGDAYLDEHYKDSDFVELAKIALSLHKEEDNLGEYICLSNLRKAIAKKDIGSIIDMVFHKYDMKDERQVESKPSKTSAILDKIKDQGFKYSTISSVTIALSDIKDIKNKDGFVKAGQEKVEKINEAYNEGFITNEERYKQVINIWTAVTDQVAGEVAAYMKKDNRNPLIIMADSGARGSLANFKQLIGMKGLVSNPKNEAIELPIISSYRTGVKVNEFFINTHGARKGGADTALKTADSGYLTRRLVDVSQDVIVREDDCHCDHGYKVRKIEKKTAAGNMEVIASVSSRINGRYAMHDIVNPTTGEIIVPGNTLISEAQAQEVEKAGIEEVEIRSIFTCQTKEGVCRHCYGLNMATGHLVELGEAVGIMAAQSIGEPGTQLTMRVFHTGGMAGEDITSGLPRVQELVEARNPKGQAIIAKFAGVVTNIEHKDDGAAVVTITSSAKSTVESNTAEVETYDVPRNAKLADNIKVGGLVEAGGFITKGSKKLQDLLDYTDVSTVESYLLREIKMVYAAQGIELSDKHLEIIIRQMLRKMFITDSGDTNLLPGTRVDIDRYTEANQIALANDKRPAIGRPLILGITKAALETESFLSAASFQETTRVLTDAAIKAKRDNLHGLKENVITGKLIPTGSGLYTEEEEKERLSHFDVLTKMKEVKAQYVEAHDRKDNLND